MTCDLLFLLLLVIFCALGWRRGLIRSLGALLGLIVACVAANAAAPYLQQPLAEWLEPYVENYVAQKLTAESLAALASEVLAVNLARLIVSAAVFLLVLWLWKKLVRAVDGVFRLPILRTLNRAGGLLFGLIEAVILIYAVCQAMALLGMPAEDSAVYTALTASAGT